MMAFTLILLFSCNQDDVFSEIEDQESKVIGINYENVALNLAINENTESEISHKRLTRDIQKMDNNYQLKLGKSDILIEELVISR